MDEGFLEKDDVRFVNAEFGEESVEFDEVREAVGIE